MTVKTLLNALDTIVDVVEFYHGDYFFDFSADVYNAMKVAGKVKKFRVYEGDDSVTLMVVM